MTLNRASRRQFLKGFAGFTLALPYLPSMSLAAATPRKRFVALFHANGVVADKWYPAQAANVTLAENIRALDLTKISGPISATFNSRFDRYKSKMLLLRGVDCIQKVIAGHDVNLMLGGKLILRGDGSTFREGNMSIDQAMARSSIFYPTAPAFRSLHVRAHGQWTGGNISFGPSGTRIVELPSIDNPLTVFNQMFKNYSPSSQPSATDKLKIQNTNAVDLVREDYLALKNSKRISREDKLLLDAHLTFLNELENRLKVLPAPNSCTVPTAPSGLRGDFQYLAQICQAQMQNIAAAIRCGQTSIATLCFSHFSDNSFYNAAIPGLPNLVHHDMAHNDDLSGLQKLREFWSQHVATLLDLLDVVEDPTTGATFLDNSVVYWGSENSLGSTHSHFEMPCMLAGGAGGYFKTGRFIDYRNMNKRVGLEYGWSEKYYMGRPYNELLVTLLQSMGLQPADYEINGQQGWGDYTNEHGYTIGDRRSPLPFIRG